jgi:hypothetical protein
MTHTELMALADAYAYQKALINVSQMMHSQILEADEARAALSDALKQVVQDAERWKMTVKVLGSSEPCGFRSIDYREMYRWEFRVNGEPISFTKAIDNRIAGEQQ